MLTKFTAKNKYAPVFILAFVSIFISCLTRIVLLVAFGKTMQLSLLFTGSFFIGLLYDIVVSAFIVIPLVLQIAFTNEGMYSKTGKIMTTASFLILLFLLFFTNVFPKDYNKDLFKVLQYYVMARFAIYLFLCFTSKEFRYKWRSFIIQSILFISFFLLLFNAISEIVFWQEFSCRYNFIAVDYLVYTHEVVGNIRESYPVTTIIIGVALCTIAILWYYRKRVVASVYMFSGIWQRTVYAVILLIIPLLFIFSIKPGWISFSANNYANELAGNGIYQFVQAFQNNELDFYRFYKTIPDNEAFTIVKKELGITGSTNSPADFTVERQIQGKGPEKRMNVVMISVESLSASFMKAFGNTQNITPQLDSLAQHSLFFTNAYASGTRTVRGLEALALSIPPTPGQSIVKRPDNENLFSLGSVFKSKGYITQFIYGGYGYFDNMNYFFSHNDYDVIDRAAISPEETHYANIWGVADEDLFTLSLKELDKNYQQGKPFFTQIMTVSNHRPFTYPDGRIDIKSDHHSREGGVKYTDYAIGDFIKRASAKPWFSNTLFVIVADHCASSAGSSDLPVTGYHIPLLMYSPSLINTSQKVDILTGQIDIAPTILGLLGFSYKSKFFGQDVFDSVTLQRKRAFISTYQGLGFLAHENLIVQSPVKKVNMYKPNFENGDAIRIPVTDSLEKLAIAYYQVASWLIKNGGYQKSK